MVSVVATVEFSGPTFGPKLDPPGSKLDPAAWFSVTNISQPGLQTPDQQIGGTVGSESGNSERFSPL